METKNEAFVQVEEILKVINGSNKAFLSGERMICSGITICLAPVIELVTKGMTFEIGIPATYEALVVILHIAFYWGLFQLLSILSDKLFATRKEESGSSHPLIIKAFKVYNVFWVAIIGLGISLSIVNQGQLIHPLVFVLLGFLFYLYGQFSNKLVRLIAWSYIILGIFYIFMTKFNIENLWIYFILYQGISLILLGNYLRKRNG